MSLILALTLYFASLARAKEVCHPPDVPLGGSYSPVHRYYLPGDRVEYSCEQGLVMSESKWRIKSCEANGNWSFGTPFCDTPTTPIDPRATKSSTGNWGVRSGVWHNDIMKLIDGNNDTCYTFSDKATVRLMVITDDKAIVVTSAHLFTNKGLHYIEFKLVKDTNEKKRKCTYFDEYSDGTRWIWQHCRDDPLKFEVHLQEGDTVNACEIEAILENGTQAQLEPNSIGVFSEYKTGNVLNLVDGNTDTCFTLSGGGYGRGPRTMHVNLPAAALLYGIRLFLPKGTHYFQINTSHKGDSSFYRNLMETLGDDQWFQIYCDGDCPILADSLAFGNYDGRTSFIVCEIEVVLVKTDLVCQNPPETFIPNGHLEVSREKAVLQCNPGFNEGQNNQLLCDKNNTWTGPDLQCYVLEEILCDLPYENSSGIVWRLDEEKPYVGSMRVMKCQEPDFIMTGEPTNVTCLENGTWTSTNAKCDRKEAGNSNLSDLIIVGIAVGAVIVIMLFTCIGITIYVFCKPKKREVVVAFLTADYTSTAAIPVPEPAVIPEPEPVYNEIRDSYFNDRPESDYYLTPIN